MKKAVSILSIISIVIAVVSLILVLGMLTVLWEPLCALYSSPEIAEAGPILPIGTMIYMVGCLAVAAAVLVFAKSSRSIAFEIIAIILLSIVLPLLTRSFSVAQTLAVSSIETLKLAALGVANNISRFPSGLMAVAEALCLVVCGMSISEKVISKKSCA